MSVNWMKSSLLKPMPTDFAGRIRRAFEHMLYCGYNEWLIREDKVELANFGNGSLDGLRVIVVSDLHVRDWHDNEGLLTLLVDEINRRKPDLIFLLGDFVARHDCEAISPEDLCEQYLARLESKYGTFAVLGNHDLHFGKIRLTRALNSANITVLSDQVQCVELPGGKLQIGGAAEIWTENSSVDLLSHRLKPEFPSIVLSHAPDIFYQLPDFVALTLAGHTHAGQIRLPGVQGWLIPHYDDEKFDYGEFHHGHKTLMVTAGIGTSRFPLRLNCPGEILDLTLYQQK